MKRSLSLVLVLALVLGMFSAFALSAGAEDVTPEAPGTTTTEPTFPEGAVAVATAEEFAAMEAGKYYYLTADITVNATYTTDFTGTFDGNGHTVTTSVVLFTKLVGATVKNLTIAGEIDATADTRAASLAREGSGMTIENVTNNANITAGAKGGYVGGLVAQGLTGKGKAAEHEKCYFTNCVNNGNITYKYDADTAESTPRVGGMTGNVAKYQHAVYTNCVNNGKISVTGTGLTSAPYVSGIAGSSFGGEFVNCVNNGDLYCTAGAHMGGILGRGTPSSQKTDQSSSAVGCVNTGNLTIESTTSTSGTVGGIFGHCGNTMSAGANAVYTVEKSVNMGTLTCSGSQVGGIIGYVWGSDSKTTWSYPVIKDCINLGKVVGTKKITFAEGEVPNPATFLATFASQFMGYVNATNTTIENCYGLGTVVNTNEDYSVIFGLSSFKSLDYNNIKNVYLRANDGTKNYSWACDTATEVKDEAGNITGYTITEDRTANRVSLDAYKALEDKAGNIVNDKDLFAVVEGTEASLIEAAVTAINANDNGFFFVDGGKVNSLEAAVAAVKDGGTIVLLNNITLSAALTLTAEKKDFTIDGAGYAITGKVALSTPGCNVTVKNLEVNGALETKSGVTGITVTLIDCHIWSHTSKEYPVRVTSGNKLYILSGTYENKSADSCLEVKDADAFCEVRGGKFTSNQNCAARAYNGATLNIYDGEFYYTGTGTAKGSAIRGGTGSNGGTVNIYGGTFSSKGELYAVINAVHKDGVINITGGKFINAGAGNIAVFEKLNEAGERVNVIEFPEGQKEYVFEAPTPGGDDTTTGEQPGGDDTTTGEQPGGDDTTTGGDNTTTETPADTKKPGDTTKAPEEGGCNGCGGFAVAAQVVALLVGVVGVALVVKRK